MRDRFEEYLIRKGFKVKTPKGQPSTVYNYLRRIDYICEIEKKDWIELSKIAISILPDYEIGGKKEIIGSESHGTVRCALSTFCDFLKEEYIGV